MRQPIEIRDNTRSLLFAIKYVFNPKALEYGINARADKHNAL